MRAKSPTLKSRRKPSGARSVPRAGASSKKASQKPASPLRQRLVIPADQNEVELETDGHTVHLTNLRKPFWPELGITKGNLIQYYADVSPVLLPHLKNRAMVMKRYPDGAAGKFFFQKRVPDPHPEWIDVCKIQHSGAGVVDFPVVRDLASLLWTINLGCIDLNPWYARCDDAQRPDYLHFDLDPVEGADFGDILETALRVHEALNALKIPNYAKTTGSRGIHVYVPIVRGPTQKQVWEFAKQLAQSLESLHPKLITAVYQIARRPKGHVLVDYNQNVWGKTLASVYSVRPKTLPTVSAPISWQEITDGILVEEFRMENMPARIAKVGDLWKPLLESKGRFQLEKLL